VEEGERERGRRFDALFEAHCPDVVAYCGWRTGSASDAEEAVAEVFLTAWRRLDEVPGGDATRVWLYATGRRVIANHAGRRAAAQRWRSGSRSRRRQSQRVIRRSRSSTRRFAGSGRSIARSCCSPNGKASRPHRSHLSCGVRRSPREAGYIAPVGASARPSKTSPKVSTASDAGAQPRSHPRLLSRTHLEENHEHVTELRSPAQG
jgi:Sigma-70 region 2